MVEVRLLWAEPARQLIRSAPPSLDGFWSVIYVAANAATWLGESDPRRWDSSCLEAALDLSEALGEIEWVDPAVVAGATVDLGPVTPLDSFDDCLAQTAQLVREAVGFAVGLLGESPIRWEHRDLIAVSRAVTLLSRAYTRLTGTLL
jgi:hypothetical protein